MTAMDDERAARVVRNEALYRQVNERIEGLNSAFGGQGDDFGVVCECGTLECAEQVRVPREVYEQTRADAHQFVVVPGHEVPDLETVVLSTDEYLIVHKRPGVGTVIAEETDTRP